MASSSSSDSKKSSAAEATIQSQEAIGSEKSSSSFSDTPETSDTVGGVNVSENPDAANPDSNEATQTDSADSNDTVDDLMENGSKALQGGQFAKAAKLFKRVLRSLDKNNAEFVQAKLKYGLALQAPIQIEDELMTEAVPMEADYLLHSNDDAKQVRSPTHNNEDLESAWVALLGVRSVVEEQPGDSMEKVDIFSALGEVALKIGICNSAYTNYQVALSILERLVEDDNQRIAHLNFKLCLCMANCNKITEAIEYCEKAISVCKKRIQRLTDESKSSSGIVNVKNQDPSSVHDVGPSLLKNDEVVMLELLSREFEMKLVILQQRLKSSPQPIPDLFPSGECTGGSSEFESPTASTANIQLSADPASNEQSSTHTSTSGNQPGGFEDTPTASTAHTNERDVDVPAKGAKRQLLTDPSNNESTPTKKPSLDPSGEEEGTP